VIPTSKSNQQQRTRDHIYRSAIIIMGSGQWWKRCRMSRSQGNKDSLLGKRIDKRFIMIKTWSEDMGCNIFQFLLQFIIVPDNN